MNLTLSIGRKKAAANNTIIDRRIFNSFLFSIFKYKYFVKRRIAKSKKIRKL
ncbi:hypothetical protein BRDCF_p1836 [Bacteroidales bacterium CF]|nr:hypothetical protein BRDCF_p1836 [Bacteroidales bacterium CF]